MSIVQGKNIALTGTLVHMKRSEASKALEELGASVGSLTRSTDILIYGNKAGSKLQKAQRMGVETRNEDWLVALLAGEDPDAGDELTGALADYMERVEEVVEKLRNDPRVRVSYYRAPGVSSTTLTKVAESWGVEAFSEGIENFYRQCNGFQLTWIGVNHPSAKDYGYINLPSETQHPTSWVMEQIPWDLGGKIWVLPIEDALNRTKPYVSFAYDVVPHDEERQAHGKTWVGEELERALRLVEFAHDYYPAAFLIEEGDPNPSVLIGDDHGAGWEDVSTYSFAGYLETLLEHYGHVTARRSYGDNEFDFDTFLPAPVTAEVGDTFSVEILSVEDVDLIESRARRIASRYDTYYKEIAKHLDIGDRSSRDAIEVCRDIAEATASLKDVDMKVVKKIGTRIYVKKPGKGTVHAALFGTLEEPGKLVTAKIETLFDATKQGKYNVAADMGSIAHALFGKEGIESMGVKIVSKSGRKKRVTTVEFLVPSELAPEPGASLTSDICPNGFTERDGAYVWNQT